MSRSADDHAREASPARSLRHRAGRDAPGVGGIRRRPGPRQSGQLADASRIRVGKPGLETLDSVLFRALPLRALRRARLRHERLAGGALSVEQWAADLESVIDAARPTAPVTLLGISQGAATCIHYAIRHPERVARMILYGGYARGGLRRGSPRRQTAHQAMVDLMRVAWGKDNPTFRQVFTSRFIPGGSHEQLQWFNDLCLKTTLWRDRGQVARGARRCGYHRGTRSM